MAVHGSNNDDVRRHNLSTILGIVHRNGATPRSQLTRMTGLNRSTVAALVAELVELGLALEREPDATKQVGRPSPVVAVDPRVVALAVNPEIDAVTIAVVGLGGHVHRRIRHVLEHSPSVTEAVAIAESVIAALRGELDAGFRVAGIGLAVPGQVRSSDGMVRLAPHLDWVDAPIASLLSEASGYPAFAANDAGLGAIAEWHFGAGRGCRDLVYLNGGASGIGGGIIAAGAPFGGVGGFAGEFGHIRVSAVGDAGAHLDSAGIAGTLESEVRLSALLSVLGLGAEHAEDLDDALLAALADDGAPGDAARAEVARQLGHLGTALGAAVNVLNPELVVLGGFLASLLVADPAALDAALSRSALAAPREDVSVVRAELGPNLLMVGAAELAFAPLLGNPAGFGWPVSPGR
ncbi:MAG: ROK family transcriptional regulator [Microterricola sp.]